MSEKSSYGYIHRWGGSWGLIHSTGGKRYFLHKSKIVSGQPEDGARVEFNVGPPRSAADLPTALDVEIVVPAPTPMAEVGS